MVGAATDTLREVDVVVLVVDAASPPGAGDRFVLDLIKKSGTPALLALNKIDRIRKHALLPLIESYARAGAFKAIVPVSALTGDGSTPEREIIAALPEREALCRRISHRPDRARRGRAFREKVLRHTHDELPFDGRRHDHSEEPAEHGGLTPFTRRSRGPRVASRSSGKGGG
jgi:GTP-binding protein Era